MNFDSVNQRDAKLLSEKEIRLINNLVSEGKKTLIILNNECTYEKLRKTIKNYVNKISDNQEIIESIINRTLSSSPRLSITINNLITNAQELISILKKAQIINKYGEGIINNLTRMLARYKVIINIKPKINYWNNKAKCKKNKIIMNINELTISDLVLLILNTNNQLIKNHFLLTEQDRINNNIIKGFINELRTSELRLAINEKPELADFLMKLFVALQSQAKQLKQLKNKINNAEPLNQSELSATKTLIINEIKKLTISIKKVMSICKQAREKGVNTERLISQYHETELMSNTKEIIKSFLRINYKINDLIKQVAYEFLTTYEAVPDELSKYNDYKNKSRYELLKELFN